MAGSKGIYYGQGNRGQATILDSPSVTDVIGLRQRRLELEKADKQKQKEDFFANMDIKAEEIRSLHTEQKHGLLNNFYDMSTGYAKNYDNMSDEDKRLAKIEMQRAKSNIDMTITNSNKYAEKEQEMLTVAKSNTHLNVPVLEKKQKALLFNDDGTIKPIGGLDESQLDTIYDNPEVWNGRVVISDFVKSLNDSKSDYWKTNGGYDEKTTIKSNLFKFNESGEQEFDENTGEPKLNVTPQTLNFAKKDNDMALQIQFEKKAIAEEEGRTDVTEMEAFKRLISPLAYKEEIKQKKANEFAKIDAKQKVKTSGTDKEESVYDLWFKNLDTTITHPTVDDTKSPKYSIAENGAINENTNGKILLPVHSQLIGEVVGGQDDDGKTIKSIIEEVVYDPSTKKVYYKTSGDKAEFSELNTETANDLTQSVFGSGGKYKYEDGIAYGTKSGRLSTTQDNITIYKPQTTESEATKIKDNNSRELQERVTTAITDFKTVMGEVFEIEKKESGNTHGYSGDFITLANEQLKKLPENTTITIGEKEYVNPVIEIYNKGALVFNTKGDYRLKIDGIETDLIAEDNLQGIIDGLKPNFKMKSKDTQLGAKRDGGAGEKHGSKENPPVEGDEIEVEEGVAVFKNGKWELKK